MKEEEEENVCSVVWHILYVCKEGSSMRKGVFMHVNIFDRARRHHLVQWQAQDTSEQTKQQSKS
jgi:hypothetical protein